MSLFYTPPDRQWLRCMITASAGMDAALCTEAWLNGSSPSAAGVDGNILTNPNAPLVKTPGKKHQD